jgi:hypothetical protein
MLTPIRYLVAKYDKDPWRQEPVNIGIILAVPGFMPIYKFLEEEEVIKSPTGIEVIAFHRWLEYWK